MIVKIDEYILFIVSKICFQGLYPASHGIIDNSMYDTASGKLFKVGRNVSLEPFWWEKEPVSISTFRIVSEDIRDEQSI